MPPRAAAVIHDLDEVPRRARSLALGMFDGVHLGHREVIRGADCVATFAPHPASVITPTQAPRLLTSVQRRAQLVGELGVRELVVIGFDTSFAAYSPERFVEQVLIERLAVARLSVGEGFRFGRHGAGDTAMLQADGRFDVRVVPLLCHGGEIVSSTRIRRLLGEGDVPRAAELLGAPLQLSARVVRDGPRSELAVSRERLVPAPGVYAARVAPARRRWREVEVRVPAPSSTHDEQRLLLALGRRDAPRVGETLSLEFSRRLLRACEATAA
jgi:riboflavin kinase/FMN adenylyltransferase